MSLPFDAADPALAPDSEEPAAPAAPDLDASDERGFDRRRFLAFAGLGAVALPAVLTAQEKGGIERKALADCETVSGLHFTDAQRDQMLKGLGDLRDSYAAIRKVHIDNGVAPAFHFDPDRPPAGRSGERPPVRMSKPAVDEPPLPQNLATDLEAVAFWPVTRLARLIRERKVTSTALTKMYLARLKRLDPTLHAVITLTEERALASADRADREIAAGRYRGPLHGIPWGAKDLLSAKGYRTTWGSVPFKEQVIDEDATAVARLEEAGAVLIAKLAVGELAWGDVWFGGMTRNPWKPEQGSSGSSAGSASTTAAGAVGFALGTETLGSIVSPCTRCGATGLRPTFGRVSRYGAMALAFSMDKIGAIGRSVEDCALVFHSIHGADGRDPSAVERPFEWNPDLDVKKLRIGYVKAAFAEKPQEGQEQGHAFDLAAFAALQKMGLDLRPIDLPALADFPTSALSLILTVESAATFDELTQSGRDAQLVRQIEQAWPNIFRQGQTIPAVSYLQANRLRTLLLREMEKTMADLDAYVVPSYFGSNLLTTNLTGHPTVVLPNGFRPDGTPVSLCFVGKLYGEAALLAVAKAYQDATGFHLKHPTLG